MRNFWPDLRQELWEHDTYAPTLWEKDLWFDLVDLTEPLTGALLSYAYEINEVGQVAATGSRSGGYRAFRLDPLPNGLGLSGLDPGRAGSENTIRVRGATPGATLRLYYSLAEGSTPVPGCPDVALDLRAPNATGSAVADPEGYASFTAGVPAAAQYRNVYIQAVEVSSCRVSNPVRRWFR